MVLLPPPPVIRHAASIGAIAAAIATSAVTFSRMDADPTLFFFDKKIRRGGRGLIGGGGGGGGQGLLPSLPSSGIDNNNKIIKETFRNKTILITGSTSGIGKEIVTQISKLGTARNLILLGARSTTTLEELGDECRRLSSESVTVSKEKGEDSNSASVEGDMNVWTIPLDMMTAETTTPTTTSSSSTSTTSSRSSNAFHAAIDKVEQILKQNRCSLDLVVLNAGIGQLDLAIQTRASETHKIFQINTFAPIEICQLLLERKLLASNEEDIEEVHAGSTIKGEGKGHSSSRSSHLVVTSSIAALTSVPLSSSYAASKAALNSYFYSLRSELDQQQNLKISLICPGPVDTNFFSKSVPSSSSSSSSSSSKEKDNKDGDEEEQSNIQQSSKSLKMSVSRCAELYISCIVMSMMVKNGNGHGHDHDHGNDDLSRNADVQEHWIASQPTLFGLYLNYLMPRLSRWIITKYVAPKRIRAWRDGKDLYDPKTWKS